MDKRHSGDGKYETSCRGRDQIPPRHSHIPPDRAEESEGGGSGLEIDSGPRVSPTISHLDLFPQAGSIEIPIPLIQQAPLGEIEYLASEHLSIWSYPTDFYRLPTCELG